MTVRVLFMYPPTGEATGGRRILSASCRKKGATRANLSLISGLSRNPVHLPIQPGIFRTSIDRDDRGRTPTRTNRHPFHRRSALKACRSVSLAIAGRSTRQSPQPRSSFPICLLFEHGRFRVDIRYAGLAAGPVGQSITEETPHAQIATASARRLDHPGAAAVRVRASVHCGRRERRVGSRPAWCDCRGHQSRSDRESPHGGDRRGGPVPHRRSARRHVHRHVHARRLQRRAARGHRTHWLVQRRGQCRPEGRRARRDDHRHRRDADRRHPERPEADDDQRRSHHRDPVRALVRRPHDADAEYGRGDGRRIGRAGRARHGRVRRRRRTQ